MELRVFLQHADMFDFEKEREIDLDAKISEALERAEQAMDEAIEATIKKRNDDLRSATLDYLGVVLEGSPTLSFYEGEVEDILDDILDLMASKYKKIVHRPAFVEIDENDVLFEFPYNPETWDL